MADVAQRRDVSRAQVYQWRAINESGSSMGVRKHFETAAQARWGEAHDPGRMQRLEICPALRIKFASIRDDDSLASDASSDYGPFLPRLQLSGLIGCRA